MTLIVKQSAPNATTETALYTVPALRSCKVASISVANRGAAAATFRISVSVGGGATANKDYLYYDLTLPAYDTFLRDNAEEGTIMLNATDVVRVYASTADLSFNMFGTEMEPWYI
jgi:hypothetical protein